MTYIWKKFQSWNASEASQKNLGSTFAPWPTFEKCSKVEMRAKRAKKIFGVTFSFDPMTYIYLVLQLYRFSSQKKFWGHFSLWPHDLHSTYYAVISILGENWQKKILATPTFLVVDLDLEWNLVRLFPTLCTLFGIDALIYTAASVSRSIESVIFYYRNFELGPNLCFHCCTR